MPRALKLVIGLVLFTFGCETTVPTRILEVKPSLSDLRIPAALYTESSQNHLVSVKVSDPQGLEDVAAVRYTISTFSGQSALQSGTLIDDGTQGDIIPKDGVYVGLLTAAFSAGQAGDFLISVQAEDRNQNKSELLSDTLRVKAGRENLPPVLSEPLIPNVLRADSVESALISVRVADPEGLSDIERVVYQIYPPTQPRPLLEEVLFDDGTHGDAFAADGIYSRQIDSGFAGGKPGLYSFRFEAKDRAGNKSNAPVGLVKLTRKNDAPVISNLKAPGQISRSSGQTFLLTVDAYDPQGLGDIDRVFFNSFRPDGSPATGNPFLMHDDGQLGDVKAGDGTYSLTITISAQNATGDYRFEFQAVDKSGFESNKIIHIITVVP